MTVSNNQTRVSYTGDGSSTSFAIPYPFYLSTDITVMLGTAVQSSGYSISGGVDATGAPQPGTVTFSSPPASTVAVQFILNVPLTQLVNLVDGTSFPSKTLNQVNDRSIQAALRLKDLLSRSITAPDGDVSPNVALPAAATRANTYLTFDSNGNVSVAQSVPSGSLSQATIGSFLYPRTAAETAAAVTPTNYAYPPGHILRYGTNTTPGTTDLSTAFTNALASNSQVYCPGSLGPYFFGQSAPFNLTSGQTIYGDGPATVLKFSFNTGNNLQMSNVVGAVVKDIAIQVTGSGGNTYIGAVAIISGSTNCKVERVSISGVSGHGVYISTSSSAGGVVTAKNTVRNCTFSAFNTGNADQSDVYIGQTTGSNGTAYNIVEGNECFGGGWHGIMIQSQNGGTGPNLSNVITNNRIGNHLAYGIVNYSGAATVDNFNQIVGNYIENIQGSALSGQSGAGIYSVAAGGNVISNNTIFNACAAATTLSGSTAGIAVTGVASGLTPVTVTGNVVSAQTKFSSIQVSNCQGGVTVTGNTVQAPNSNVTGPAIYCRTSSVIAITGNIVNQLAAQEGITIQADANLTQVVIADNVITHAGSFGIHVSFTSTFTTTGLVVKGNTVTSASAINIVLQNAVQAAVSDNVCLSNTICIQLTTSTQARLTNNVLTTTGAVAFATSGACASSLFNETNYCSSTTGVGIVSVNNAGTGCNVRQLGTGVPGAGTQILGDAVYNTAGVTPFAWSCTTAGTPGTFTGVTLP